VLFLLSSAPPAAAGYIMVVAAGGNGPLAANIVVIGTLISSLSITLGLALLQVFGWI
jgi:malonate transporter